MLLKRETVTLLYKTSVSIIINQNTNMESNSYNLCRLRTCKVYHKKSILLTSMNNKRSTLLTVNQILQAYKKSMPYA